MNEDRINSLSYKLLTGEISAAEKQELEDWYANFDSDEHHVHSELTKQEFKDRLYQEIAAQSGLKPVRRINYYRSTTIAASLFLLLTAGLYTVYLNKEQPQNLYSKQISNIKPGGNRAMLTLANGKTIDLEAAPKGILPTGGQQSVNKTAEGNIAYQADQTKGDNSFNTLTTPRGGKFSIRLADGTLAILDAESSIRYPLSFNGNKRTVEVRGQVYFEVVHNAKQPFIVKIGGQTIEDLGTHFNVNAYPDGKGIKTTLEEGRVSITNNTRTVFLKPGQAALSNLNQKEIIVSEADLEETLAWKNGYFRFKDEHIENIMSQLSRWYNIDIAYSGKLPDDGFNGTISRSKNLSQVLKMLERTGIVHFKSEGRRITVLP